MGILEPDRKEAQEVLDELFNEALLPFALTAHAVEPIGLQEYMIRFNDSRLRSVLVSWYEGLSFKDVFRTATLERVKAYSGPLRHISATKTSQ